MIPGPIAEVITRMCAHAQNKPPKKYKEENDEYNARWRSLQEDLSLRFSEFVEDVRNGRY